MGLAGLWAGPAAPGLLDAPGGEAAYARLDTGEISPQGLESFGEPTDGADAKREESRRRKRGYHAELVRILEGMQEGKHGLVAMAVAGQLLPAVRRCPGVVRRHRACGRRSFEGHKCDCSLCPWCQAKRSKRLLKRLGPLVALMHEPKLWTFSPPNLLELDRETVGGLGKVLTKLHRQGFLKKVCVGGVRSIEVTNNGNGWNLHVHEAVDSGWVAQYPQTDIRWVSEPYWSVVEKGWRQSDLVTRAFVGKHWVIERKAGRWVVEVKHPGLAREFTRLCQEVPGLRSPRLDFDLDNPDHWYFVDLRVANRGVAEELCKYVAKGSQVVRAGAGAVVEYLFAMKGQRLIQPFGNLYGVEVEGKQDESAELAPEREGDCPYDDCPSPGVREWDFIQYGFPLEALERNPATGTYRLIFQGDG